MYAIETLEPTLGPWLHVLRPAPTVAVLITLETRDASPLLAVDPRAGDAVALRLRHLHADDQRVLAWAVLADGALCLVTSPGREAVARLVSHLVDRTTDDLARLGHEQVWRWPAETMLVAADHDLAMLLESVLHAPERAGVAERWRDWRWAGSCHWPEGEPEGLRDLAPGLLWLDALTGCRLRNSLPPVVEEEGDAVFEAVLR